jgi:hypothetical protein
MLFSQEETLEEKLVGFLLNKPLQVKDLHERLISTEKISLRAVYKAVNALIKAGVIVKVGKRMWINQEWVRSIQENISPPLPLLSPGESISYTFTSIEHLDTFWKTIVLQLEQYEQDGKIFFYNPHNFWAYIPERKESEDKYYAYFEKSRKHAYFTVGGISSADMEFKRAYQNDFLQIDARSIPSFGRNNHITVLGNFVISVRLTANIAARLDKLYALNESMEKILPDIVKETKAIGNIKFVFEHNAAKAKKIRKVLSPNFFFKG